MAETLFRLLYASWLPAGSFLAGILNSIAGGGSFLSLPPLFDCSAAIGVGAVAVQATNTVALWPGQLTGLVASARNSVSTDGNCFRSPFLRDSADGSADSFYSEPETICFANCCHGCCFCGHHVCAQLSSGPLAENSLRRYAPRQAADRGHDHCQRLRWLLRRRRRIPRHGAVWVCGVHDIHEMNALKVLTAAVSLGIPAISFIACGTRGVAFLSGDGYPGSPGRIYRRAL